MPRKSKPKQAPPQKQSQPRSQSKSSDYEQYLIDKIAKCQRVVSELEGNQVWREIQEDYELTCKGLDSSWAFEDSSTPRFKHMQITKMAAQTFMNLLPNYKHDLEMAQKELSVFQAPESEVKKDYDDEGITPGPVTKTLGANAYHGR